MATFTDKKSKLLVAAIDFGTTYSGYAFSMKHQYKDDPLKVSVNQAWVAGSMALTSYKAPTCVLFDENKLFHSFGYEAEDTYSELALDKEHEKWYFFKRFKMRLHDKKVKCNGQFFSLNILLYIAVLLCFTCTVLVIHLAFTTLLYSKVKFIK